MRIDILTLFPDMFTGVFNSSILKQAQQQGAVTLSVTNFRNFSDHKHLKVDDYPYGGGAGMVLKAQPIFDAVNHLQQTPITDLILFYYVLKDNNIHKQKRSN